jgi:hypothetical protein
VRLGTVGTRGVVGEHRWIPCGSKSRWWARWGIDGSWVGIQVFRTTVRDAGGQDWAQWGVDGSWTGPVGVQRFCVAVRGTGGLWVRLRQEGGGRLVVA